MKVVFLGNHTVGVRSLEAVSEGAEVVGVVAHPPDLEDGVRYESVFQFAEKRGFRVVRGTGKDFLTQEFIAAAKPDLLWITDFRYLIPSMMVSLAPLGAVNLHPSLLPAYRGRASINWAILKGETKLGLTGHFVDEGMDTGDIIEQVSYELGEDQDVGDCLNILYPLYTSITRKILVHFRSGTVPRTPQDHTRATVFPRRKPEDGAIDWSQPARSICNLVRAVAVPYPGAFTTWKGKKVYVWKARVDPESDSNVPGGQVIGLSARGLQVQCGEGVLTLTSVNGDVPTDRLDETCCLGT
jgi:methionyl-tRNA formyltransferase